MTTKRLPCVFIGCALIMAACADDGDGATATLRAPRDRAKVAGGVEVEMAADGVEIEAAGQAREGAGHFHVIIDDGCMEPGTAVPSDADHVHFGDGQSGGTVYVGPGEHELCLQVADGEHTALDITDTVTVTAGIGSLDQWCRVAGEADELFTATDNGGADFAVKQIAYESLTRLFAQLSAAIDEVDGDAREVVAAAVADGSFIANAFAAADDAQGAVETLQEAFGPAGPTLNAEAAAWISETCGVDIDS